MLEKPSKRLKILLYLLGIVALNYVYWPATEAPRIDAEQVADIQIIRKEYANESDYFRKNACEFFGGEVISKGYNEEYWKRAHNCTANYTQDDYVAYSLIPKQKNQEHSHNKTIRQGFYKTRESIKRRNSSLFNWRWLTVEGVEADEIPIVSPRICKLMGESMSEQAVLDHCGPPPNQTTSSTYPPADEASSIDWERQQNQEDPNKYDPVQTVNLQTVSDVAASFDCSKAVSVAEMTICNDIVLSTLDGKLGTIYKRAKDAAPDKEKFRQQSRASFRWRENNCHDRECLLKWYAQRKETLENIIGEGFLVNASNVKYMSLEKAMDGAELIISGPAGQVYPSKVQLYFSQTRLKLVAVFGENYRVSLPYSFDIGYGTDGEMSWEKQGNEYAIAQHDVTGDGLDEIIFAVLVPGENWNRVQVNAIQFFPPKRSSDLGRSENWALTGNLKDAGIIGEPNVILKENAITIPRNFRDFYTEITWANGRFVNSSYY